MFKLFKSNNIINLFIINYYNNNIIIEIIIIKLFKYIKFK